MRNFPILLEIAIKAVYHRDRSHLVYCKKWQKGVFLMSHHHIAYEDVLRAAGHRVTPQRILILDAVCDGASHTTLGEIYARVRVHNPSIDRSTLYRTLKLYVELGLVVSAEPGDGEIYYEIAKPQRHHHLVCRKCGRGQEIDHAIIHSMFDQLREVYRFSADSDHLVIMGICADCAG